MGYSQVQAGKPVCSLPAAPDPNDVNLGDGWCTEAEINAGWAIQIDKYCVELTSGTPYTGGPPYDETTCDGAACLEYKWKVSTVGSCQAVASWRHLTMVFALGDFSNLDFIIEPSGIRGAPGDDETSCSLQVEQDEAFLKSTPTVACEEKCVSGTYQIQVAGTFSVIASADAVVSSVWVAPKYGSTCFAGGYLVGPGGSCANIDNTEWNCGPTGKIIVSFDGCSREPNGVAMTLAERLCYSEYGAEDYPYLLTPEGTRYYPQKAGPGFPGQGFCRGEAEHIYLWNNRAWYGQRTEDGPCPIPVPNIVP